jgi:hypothetical protein
VQNVEAHNFAADWHLKFGEILGETDLGRCPAPVHRRRVLDCVGIRDGNGQGRVRVKHLPARWHTRLFILYPYPPNVTGKNPYPYPYPQGTRRVKGYPMGININMPLSSYSRLQY